MYKHLFVLPVAVFFALLVPQIDPANVVQVDSVRQQIELDGNPKFKANQLVLNGKSFDYANFSIITKGTLAVVAGNPETEEATKIPFRIYIKRGGKVIHKGAPDSDREVYDVDIASVLAFAQIGDELVIDPTRETDGLTRRVIKVKVFPNLNWLFPNWRSRSSGC